jgi:predicted esterase
MPMSELTMRAFNQRMMKLYAAKKYAQAFEHVEQEQENALVTLEYWKEMSTQGWLLAVPQSSQIYDPNSFVWNDRQVGISEIRAHLALLNREQILDQDRIVLGGFSMGGGLAIWMALNQSIKTRGFIALAPYLTPAELEALPALLANQRPTNLRGSILVGNEDIESLEVSRKIVEIMHAYDLTCELKIHPGPDHDYPSNFGEYLGKGLAFIEVPLQATDQQFRVDRLQRYWDAPLTGRAPCQDAQ